MSTPIDFSSAGKSHTTLYAIVRARIVHEDELVNQRLVWMITLNGLLFTAYGFSLSAEGSSLAAFASAMGTPHVEAARKAYDQLAVIISTVREAMTWIGIGSSLAAFFGVIAANRAIRNDQAFFAAYLREQRGAGQAVPTFPPIAGKHSTNGLGMLSGMAVPFLMAGSWMWTMQKYSNWFLFVIGLALGLVAWLMVWVLNPAGGQSASES